MSNKVYREFLLRAYRRSPVQYIQDELKATLTGAQKAVVKALKKYKRVIVQASHGVGKSYVAASAVCWHFACFPQSITITTAPTAAQVKDVLWKEIRGLYKGPGLYPIAPRMQMAADWFAEGRTAAKPDGFQGRHAQHLLVVFDEAVGVKASFYDAAEGMMSGEECMMLLICNPTDSTSWVKKLADSGDFHVIRISALKHPNIVAQLKGEAPPFKGAVQLRWLERAFRDWTTKLGPEDTPTATDVEWPPDSGQWYRPGPIFEGRVLGRWPTRTTNNVWSEAHWLSCLTRYEINPEHPLEVGCDVARFGDDFTVIFIRRGPCVLERVKYNGNDTVYTTGQIIALIRRHLLPNEAAQGILIKVDDDGVGGGVSDQLNAQNFNVVRVLSAQAAFEPEHYYLRRSELWFSSQDLACQFMIDVSRLDREAQNELKADLLAVRFKFRGTGQREVESKEDLKKPDRLGHSPDDGDAFNLCFAPMFAPGLNFEDYMT